MRHSTWLGATALCCLLAACSNHSDDNITVVSSHGHVIVSDSDVSDLSHGNIQIDHGTVTVRASGAPDAFITADGDLRIGQQPVAVDAAQRALLKTYYGSALSILNDGIATGKAGAAVGEEAAKSVVKRLATGDVDKIQQDIDAKVKPLQEQALKICTDLDNIKSSQDRLASTLPAFLPYGHIVSARNVDDCRKDKDD